MNLLENTPRLRMFAGPNGSGKSTIKSILKPNLLGFYINPDEIEAEIKKFDFLDFADYGIQTDRKEVLDFFQNSTLLEKADLADEAEFLRFNENRLTFADVDVNSYYASVASDFIRQKLVLSHQSFTFETVMSSPDKINFLAKAQQFGYRTYLYYVATNSPLINISRVKYRVKTGGHDVPADKIESRYYRSLDLLSEAVKFTNRAYIFDNSGSEFQWVAEITEGKEIDIKTEFYPTWLKKYLLNKIS
jgi:predicted ABC-type ATPase